MKSNMAKQQVAYNRLKRIEALYRNVRLPESVRGKGGWRSYAQALVRGRCRIEDKNLNICLNDPGP